MKSEEKLLFAIGEISDDIIAEASTPYRKSIINRKSMTIAASIAAIAIGIGILPLALGNSVDKAGGNSAPEMGGDSTNGHLDISEEEFGTLTYHGRLDENTYSFTLLITDEAPERIDISLYSKDNSIVYTTADEAEDGVTVRRPTITVDGVAKDSLPTEIGTYDITVSFEGLEDSIEWSTVYQVGTFGYYRLFD